MDLSIISRTGWKLVLLEDDPFQADTVSQEINRHFQNAQMELITSESDFENAAGGGPAGGRMLIEVRLSRGMEAEIVENAIRGAVATVTQEMKRDGNLSRATKRLTT